MSNKGDSNQAANSPLPLVSKVSDRDVLTNGMWTHVSSAARDRWRDKVDTCASQNSDIHREELYGVHRQVPGTGGCTDGGGWTAKRTTARVTGFQRETAPRSTDTTYPAPRPSSSTADGPCHMRKATD